MPADWPTKTLGEVLRLEYGASLPEHVRTNGPVTVYGSAGPIGFHDQPLVAGPGIVVGRKGSIGRFTWAPSDFFPIDTTYYVMPVDGMLNLRWAFHLLDYEDLLHLNRATGVPGLNRADVHALRRPIPPLGEQGDIAEVLDAVDSAIDETKLVINATEALRTALLQELLTNGAHGRRRAQKSTELGSLPAHWEVVRLREITKSIIYGPRFPADKYAKEGNVATLRTTDISDDGHIALDAMPLANLDLKSFQHCLLAAGDLVITRSGSCGITAVFRGFHLPVLPGAFLLRLRMRADVQSEFLELWLNSPMGRRATTRLQAGGVQKNLNAANLAELLVPLPPREERELICDIFGRLHALLTSQRHALDCLQLSKARLASELLTGRVQVKVRTGIPA